MQGQKISKFSNIFNFFVLVYEYSLVSHYNKVQLMLRLFNGCLYRLFDLLRTYLIN